MKKDNSISKLKALNNKIIFSFLQDTSGNRFHETTRHGITIVENKEKQLKSPRWGKVLKIGKDVSSEITIGMYVLIEPLMWTTHLEYEKVKFWVTSEEKVIAVSDELPT